MLSPSFRRLAPGGLQCTCTLLARHCYTCVSYTVVYRTYYTVTSTVFPVCPGELLGEVVVGMGETLVGNYPGRALGFTAPTAGHGGDVKVR